MVGILGSLRVMETVGIAKSQRELDEVPLKYLCPLQAGDMLACIGGEGSFTLYSWGDQWGYLGKLGE